ncbi:phosphotransferase family protein [Nonomuraea endophytica]|uniref:Aminoglycoside phosphotransferase (APT) family kinase protein n=1 Tax=Nonomuraea endophytica TaxID=714136 RepID=A0A7W8EGH5_9ACTN|nr:phosphotransferase family protein [Nonomuraea endophytica]MBB5078473.1 aminoglycoside phosphotransferase (APT) family kinase protein [Nonomuraea endophytica]
MNAHTGDRVAGIVREALGAAAAVRSSARLPGGASRETWSLDVDTPGGERALILRLDSPGAPLSPGTSPESGLAAEAVLMRAALEAGVPVPEIVAAGDSYILMARVDGETIPRKILRDDAYRRARPLLAAQCGRALAAVHRMPLDALPAQKEADALDQWRDVLDLTGQPHPVFELAFRRLAATRPAGARRTVVHGDFRNGNLIVGPEGVRAVLDWELAHAGDPVEDLGWLCVKAWRFGEKAPVGGFGTYDELVHAYEETSGHVVDREALRWWEAFGVLKWGVICVMQTMRHLAGGARSVELAAIGRRVCETEWDLLELLGAR